MKNPKKGDPLNINFQPVVKSSGPENDRRGQSGSAREAATARRGGAVGAEA